jgi:SecD/SecF fusion protein
MAAERTLRIGLVLLSTLAWAFCAGLTFAQEKESPEPAAPKAERRVFKSATLIYEVSPSVEDSTINLKMLAQAINRRLNPSFFSLSRIAVKPAGTRQIKIEVGKCSAERLKEIKRLVSTAGALEFRMIANEKKHAEEIEAAKDVVENDVRVDGEVVARWVAIDWRVVELASNREETHVGLIRQARATEEAEVVSRGQTQAYWLVLDLESIPKDRREGLVTRELEQGKKQVLVLTGMRLDGGGYVLRVNQLGTLQTLVVLDEFNVTGSNLESADADENEHGWPVIGFAFDVSGTQNFAKLTTKNAPDAKGFHQQLGILFDDVLIAAPMLNEPITGGHGLISGNFTEEEVNFIVAVLNAGSLPVRLERQPVSEILVELDAAQEKPAKAPRPAPEQ